MQHYRWRFGFMLAAVAFWACAGAARAEDKPAPPKPEEKAPAEKPGQDKGGHAKGEHHPPKYKYKDADHKEGSVDASDEKQLAELADKLKAGKIHSLEVDVPVTPLAIFVEVSLWTIVVFVALLFILRKMAWGPMLEGLQKREETIQSAVDEAKLAREETKRVAAQFQAEMATKMAEIPRIMDDARRDAEALKEELRTQANKDIQTERQRLRREIETARDQALQEIWNLAAKLGASIAGKVLFKTLTPDDHHRLLNLALDELRASGDRYREQFQR